MSIRPVLETRRAVKAMEGAGVHLHRAFGFQDPSELDPFLLFDDFRNENPAHFEKGFPWHRRRDFCRCRRRQRQLEGVPAQESYVVLTV